MITYPSTPGGSISVANSAELATLPVSGLPIGSIVWNIETGKPFKLTQSDRTAIDIEDTDGYASDQWTFANAVFTGFEDCTLEISLNEPNEAFSAAYVIDTVDDPTIVTPVDPPEGATSGALSGSVVLFSDALVTDSVVSANGTIGMRWVEFVPASSATADAPANATTFTAALNVSTPALKGLQSADGRAQEPSNGGNLTDASVTITPGTSKVANYMVQPATFTQARNIILSSTNCETGDFVHITFRQTTGNFNITIQNISLVTQATVNCSVNAKARKYSFYYNGSVWAFNSMTWCD